MNVSEGQNIGEDPHVKIFPTFKLARVFLIKESMREFYVFPDEIPCVFIGFLSSLIYAIKTDNIKMISNNIKK